LSLYQKALLQAKEEEDAENERLILESLAEISNEGKIRDETGLNG